MKKILFSCESDRTRCVTLSRRNEKYTIVSEETTGFADCSEAGFDIYVAVDPAKMKRLRIENISDKIDKKDLAKSLRLRLELEGEKSRFFVYDYDKNGSVALIEYLSSDECEDVLSKSKIACAWHHALICYYSLKHPEVSSFTGAHIYEGGFLFFAYHERVLYLRNRKSDARRIKDEIAKSREYVLRAFDFDSQRFYLSGSTAVCDEFEENFAGACASIALCETIEVPPSKAVSDLNIFSLLFCEESEYNLVADYLRKKSKNAKLAFLGVIAVLAVFAYSVNFFYNAYSEYERSKETFEKVMDRLNLLVEKSPPRSQSEFYVRLSKLSKKAAKSGFATLLERYGDIFIFPPKKVIFDRGAFLAEFELKFDDPFEIIGVQERLERVLRGHKELRYRFETDFQKGELKLSVSLGGSK